METKIYNNTEYNINIAIQKLKQGELVALPTETVYGLGAVYDNNEAINKIYKAKGRPQNNPLIVHIADINWLQKLTKHISKEAKLLTEKFWPGPLTIILPKSDIVSDNITAGLNDVAIRFPSNETACRIIKGLKKPICAPSANISGKPSPTRAIDVFNDLKGKIEIIIDAGQSSIGLESTVVKVEKDIITLLRPGHITVEQLRSTINNIKIDDTVYNKTQKSAPLSPGMSYKHYAPNSELFLIDSNHNQFIKYVNKFAKDKDYIIHIKKPETILQNTLFLGDTEKDREYNLFQILRELDKNNVKKAYIESPKKTGKDLALYNRLIRAANFKIIKITKEEEEKW